MKSRSFKRILCFFKMIEEETKWFNLLHFLLETNWEPDPKNNPDPE